MDRLLTLRSAIAATLREYAQLQHRQPIETIALCDPATDNYLLVNVGWQQDRRVHDIVAHLRIVDGKIQVEWNGTDTLIDDLLDRGLSESDLTVPQPVQPLPAISK
ncbi:MAG: element excision factor XisI family protein [Geitlerinemataceae cyanobacterium]